jgi:SAM-dependent methyltransferase
MPAWAQIRQRFATPLARRMLGRPDIHVLRWELARRYIRGAGIEVGGLNQPLPVPVGVSVTYVDRASVHELNAYHPNLSSIKSPDIVADFELLDPIPAGSQDFLIANHVLEHVENPIAALVAVRRVLRTGGIAFLRCLISVTRSINDVV